MVAEAKKKFPGKEFTVYSALNTPFKNDQFNQAFSFHVFMHLNKNEIDQTIPEAYRILKPGGEFIFD